MHDVSKWGPFVEYTEQNTDLLSDSETSNWTLLCSVLNTNVSCLLSLKIKDILNAVIWSILLLLNLVFFD